MFRIKIVGLKVSYTLFYSRFHFHTK